ncbi:MAG TPA: ATP-dependent DNA ligase [Hyphomicrobiaceae bacterium]|nr:ATP-dependent DNA ligase [Hyphomicrobiaceae bacterium]
MAAKDKARLAGIDTALEPMEARSAERLPTGSEWQLEPKWDGFRCLVFREGERVELKGRAKPLTRFFPEVVDAALKWPAERFVLDGELIIPAGQGLSFDALQARLHPAESRIARLSRETPASFVVFDALAIGEQQLMQAPLSERRAALESLFDEHQAPDGFVLSPATRDRRAAADWLAGKAGLDGVVAKRLDQAYTPGERTMIKVKNLRTADCVIGGFRYETAGRNVGSLLLGLYDDEGLLHHVGFTSSLAAKDKPALTRRLEAMVEPPGFTGDAPGGPSRWSTARSAEWQPLRPELVVEVCYDHVTGHRFRHGTRLLRWRPDKAPATCSMDQITGHERLPSFLPKTAARAARKVR